MLPFRFWQVLLIASTLGLCWLAMMAVHEFGHVLNALLSGATVQRVVLHPLTISRTDVSPNPHPQLVAWGGALWGILIPVAMWRASILMRWESRYVFRFFAGFCCLANGLYLAAGSFNGAGDAGDLLRHGAAQWQLILVGLPMTVCGIWLWNGLGEKFGLGEARGKVDAFLAVVASVIFLVGASLAAVFTAG
jgi:hypothetical protein